MPTERSVVIRVIRGKRLPSLSAEKHDKHHGSHGYTRIAPCGDQAPNGMPRDRSSCC